jgi:hypothetical protein
MNRATRFFCTASLAVAGLGIAAPAPADIIDLYVVGNPREVDTTDLLVSVIVSQDADGFVFTFVNESRTQASLVDIYFEQGLAELFTSDRELQAMGAGVRFGEMQSSDTPQRLQTRGWMGQYFALEAIADGEDESIDYGINDNTEALRVRMTANDDVPLARVLDVLSRPGFRVAATLSNVAATGADVSLMSGEGSRQTPGGGAGGGSFPGGVVQLATLTGLNGSTAIRTSPSSSTDDESDREQSDGDPPLVEVVSGPEDPTPNPNDPDGDPDIDVTNDGPLPVPVPSPAAAFAGVVMLAGLAMRRRR